MCLLLEQARSLNFSKTFRSASVFWHPSVYLNVEFLETFLLVDAASVYVAAALSCVSENIETFETIIAE